MPALQGGVKFALEEAPTRLSFLVGLGRLAPCLKQVKHLRCFTALAYIVTVRGAISFSSVPVPLPQAGSPQHLLMVLVLAAVQASSWAPGLGGFICGL